VLPEPERRARFEARPVVVAPALLPKRFQALSGLAGGRLTGATYARQTAWEKAPNAEEVQLEVRLFGLTPEVEKTLLQGLRTAGLLKADEGLPPEPIEQDTLRWHVRVSPLRAPVESPREHRIDFSWRRAPTTPDAAPECAKPLATDPPPELPAWLTNLVQTGSTRRLVASRTVHEAESDRAEGVLLFHNGESNDDHVGKLAKAAKAAGFTLAVGEFVTPFTEEAAKSLRLKATRSIVAREFRSGFWVKEDRSFVNIQDVTVDTELVDIKIYLFDAAYRLASISRAARGTYDVPTGRWTLADVHDDLPLFRYLLDAHSPARGWNFARTELLGTIAYEIVCGISLRVPRRYVYGAGTEGPS
jgi:hypothetical protein